MTKIKTLRKLFILMFVFVLSLFVLLQNREVKALTTTGNASYNVTETKEINKLAYGVVHTRDLGLTTKANKTTNYAQQVNVLTVPSLTGVKIVSWANTNNHVWTLTSVRKLAKDYEAKHPGYKVIAAINGDFFDIGGTGNLRYQTTGAVVADGHFYKTTSGNTVGFTNDGSKLTLIGNKKIERTEAMVLAIYDDKDNELDIKNYTITTADGLSAPDMQITVPIYKEKTVPIKAQFINAPAYFASKTISHSLSYTSLLISGPPETVDNITEIKLSEVDFDKITGNNQTFEAALILPEGVKNKDNIETVTVKITGLENYTARTYTVSNLVVKSGGKTATLSRNIRNVKVFGPKSVLNNMAASKLYAEVDTVGLESGEHTVTARIKCKESGKVWQIGTYTATVNIK